MADYETQVLIIGSGPAGCTAGIYAARADLAPVMVTGLQAGGQLTITTDVENFPGFAEPVQGPELMERMQKQAENVGTTVLHETITSVDLSRRPFQAVADSGKTFSGQTVIIATGASARWLGLEGETTFQGQGVSACATCDGFFFRNREVAVVGGGNTAVEDALFLTKFASKVTLIHRRDSLRAEKALQDRLFRCDNVDFAWNKVVDEIKGKRTLPAGVTGLVLRDTQTGETSELPVGGVFIAIGHTPNTGLFQGQLDMDAEGYINTKPDSTATSVPGVFATGDVQDKVFRQAVTAAGTGCMGAMEAERFLTMGDGG